MIQEKKVPNVVELLSIVRLSKEFRGYEKMKNLFDSFDAFICDDKYVDKLTRILGKKFKFFKYIVPIRVTSKRICTNVINARDCVPLYLIPTKRLMVKIALTSMNVEDIMENILKSINYIVSKIPKKWKNVKSLGLKTPSSIELPFYPKLEEDNDEENESQEEKPDIEVKEEIIDDHPSFEERIDNVDFVV